jgi:tRNA (cmo5U34)-methyltransferase
MNMLEKMSDFFEARLDGYDEHMRNDIESANEFYPFTASLLPTAEGSRVLDLGCGTGLELEEYFPLCPSAKVTGIDLSEAMLSALKKKFSDKDVTLVVGSYFDAPLGDNVFDAAVSVESLHHFIKSEKVPLYKKLHNALKENGYFILTDYFAPSDEEEKMHRGNLAALKAEQGIADNEFYHYDTPLTVQHETEALYEAGFSSVEVLKSWGATYTIRAVKAIL